MNYPELKATALAALKSVEAEQQFDHFIDMVESDASARIDRFRQMNERVSYVNAETENLPLPEDFAGVISLRMDDPTRELQFVRPDQFDSTGAFARNGVGCPTHYAITGDVIAFNVAPDGPYQLRLRYKQKVPPLSTVQPTNWLIAAYPNVYLYGLLSHAGLMLEDERAGAWTSKFNAAIDAVNADHNRQSFPVALNARAKPF